MRRSLALAVGLLSVLGRCAPAYAQVAPLTSSVSSLTASSGGSGSGDIDSVAITASSPLTGTASCTTGACSFTLGLGTVTVAKGGTGLTAGTDGGILGYTATGTLASSIALTLHALLVGGGAGATPTPLGSLGTSTQVLHGAAAGDPTWGAIVNADITNATIDLTTKVTGALPVANGGSGLATTTAYSLVMAGTTATGTWAASIGPGTSGYVLTSNGAGAYPTWQAASGGGSPGGSDTQVQFNDSSAFGGDAGLTYVKATDTLSSGKIIVTAASSAYAPGLGWPSGDGWSAWSFGSQHQVGGTNSTAVGAAGFYVRSDGCFVWHSTTTLDGTTDTATCRGAAGVVTATDSATGIGAFKGTLWNQDAGTRPTCDSSQRGKQWYDAGAGGVADTFSICGKSAADSYSWVTLATF